MIDPNKVMQDAEQADRIMQRQILTMQRQRAEIARLRLTDAEREAVDEAADTSDVAAEFYSGKDHARADAAAKHAATLRGLLERLA